MIFTYNIKYFAAVKTLLVFALGVTFLLFAFSVSGFSQSVNDVEIRFLKTNDSLKVNEMSFNVLKIKNITTKRITGNLTFSGPQNWKIISFPEDHTTLNPGDSILVPIRVSPASNALGGIAYIINASFRTPQHQINTSAYLSLPSVVKWDLLVNKINPYFTNNQPNTIFNIRLSNKGNTNESVRVRLEAGKMLSFIDDTPNDNFEFINLRAYSDTTIFRTITSDKKLTFAEKLRYENNWRESAIKVTASTDQTEKSDAIQIYKLNSTFQNQRLQSSSPLNIDYQAYNLMSNQTVRNNLKVYGSLLFPNNRDIQYTIGTQNLSAADPLYQFDWNRQLIYNFSYRDNLNRIQLGYNVSSGLLHSINGRGITGTLSINRKNNLYYAITQNPFSNTLGQFVGYNTSFKSFMLTTELTHENMTDGTYNASSALLGVDFSLFKYHTFSFHLLGSKSDYNKTIHNDTSLIGFSYRINYSVNYRKFSLRFNSINSEHNYIQNSGLQQATLDAKYSMNNDLSFVLYGTHQKYAITRYPENFYNPVNYNGNDNFRLVSSLSKGGLTYQIGPNYSGSIRQLYNGLSGYKTEYITYQPGVWCSLTIKLPGYRSITPNLTVNNIRFYYKTNDPTLENYSFTNNIYYSTGLSYYDNVWRVNAYYSSGSATDLYRNALVDSKPVISRSLQLRPSYENYFFNRTVRLGASLNYSYYMPSGRENVSFNLKYDQFFKKGWTATVSGFMYTNTRVDDEKGRISTRDLNMMIGLTKSFNFQQPRLKYYDLKVVMFNDLDGDKIKSSKEPPVTDVLVQIEKDQSAKEQSNIPVIKLITDENGSICIENLPRSLYKLYFTPLSNLQSLYFLGGAEQTYLNDKSRTLYIPLAESYKIKGKIILVRDPNSTEGKIDLGGVRITATGVKGETYSVLTDNFGEFVVSVPNADKYNVHINNVFGEQFNIDANEVQVQFTQNKIINVDFTFIENKREIQFGNGGELFNFSSLGSTTDSPTNTTTEVKPEEVPAEAPAEPKVINSEAGDRIVPEHNSGVNDLGSNTYAIQLSTIKTYVDPGYFKKKYKLKGEVLYTENNGVYRYYTGRYANRKSASAAIAKLGLTAAIPALVDGKLLLSGISSVVSTGLSNGSGFTNNSGNNVESTEVPSQQSSQPTNLQPVSAIGAMPASENNVSAAEAEGNRATKPNRKQPKKGKQDSAQQNLATDSKISSIPESAGISSQQGLQSLNQQPVTEEKSMPQVVANRATSDNRIGSIIPPSDNKKQVVDNPKPAQLHENDLKPAIKNNTPLNTTSATPKTVIKDTGIGGAKAYRYTIKLDASRVFRDPNYYKAKYSLPFDVICVNKGGVLVYYAGKYESIDAAKGDIARYGISGYIVPVEDQNVGGN